MPAGRKRKLVHIKKASGTYARSREVKNQLKLKDLTGIPVPPEKLKQDALKYWNFVLRHLESIDELKENFLLSVFITSKWYQILMDAFRDIENKGNSTVTASYTIARYATKILVDFEREYGLTLLSSQKIEGKTNKDALEDILE